MPDTTYTVIDQSNNRQVSASSAKRAWQLVGSPRKFKVYACHSDGRSFELPLQQSQPEIFWSMVGVTIGALAGSLAYAIFEAIFHSKGISKHGRR